VSALGLYFVACVLLAGAGGAKAIRPDDTARALAPLGRGSSLRARRVVVRGVAAAEGVLGLVGLAYPDRWVAAAVALSYGLFVVLIAIAWRSGGVLATCGCFGEPDTPPTPVHAAINLVLVGAAIAVSWAGPAESLPSVLRHEYAHGVPLLAASLLCAWLAFLCMSKLARLQSLRRTLTSTTERLA
jgi:hypothetical protein